LRLALPNLHPALILLCAQVTVIPEVKRSNVFNKGKPCGLTNLQPFGGKSVEPRPK